MATKSIIQVLFESKNANSTIADINRLDKSQTRLAQTSASAGRTFAAQSQGLGGLVAAYAAAAATTFALQQAYSKLADAARTTQTLQGLASLATVAGESSSKLLESVREITNSQLTLAESAAQINLSLSAGFSSEQIEGLSEVALKASRALGRDLTDAYSRVVRGSAKLETELLDELGIYTKIEPATRAYAAAIGKNVTALTEFERRQAFANSVIAEGQRKFSSINTTLPTSAEAIEAFGVKVLDLTTKVGQFIADAIAPLATFLTNNLSNAFAAVGLAAGLVGSKSITVLQDGIKSFAESGVRRVEQFEEALTSLVPTIRQAQESTKTFLQGLSTTQPLTIADNTRELERFIELSKKGNLTLKETEAVYKLLASRKSLYADQIASQSAFLVKQEAILEATKKSLVTDKLSEKQKEQLSRKVDRFTTLVNKLNNELNESTIASAAASLAYDNIGKSYDTLGKKASSLIATIGRGVPNTINFVGKAATSLLSLGSTLLSVVSTFTLIGTQIANIFGKEAEFNSFVMGISNAIKSLFVSIEDANFEKAAQSLVAGALAELEKTDEELRNIEEFKFTSKILGVEVELTKTREDLIREVSNAFESVSKSENSSFIDSVTSEAGAAGTVIGGQIGAAIGTAILPFAPIVGTVLGAALGAAAGAGIGAVVDMLRNDVDELSRNEEARLARLYNNEDLFAGDSGERLSKVLNYIAEQVGVAKDLSLEGFKYYETQVKLAIVLSENVDNLLYLQQVANELGVDAQKILSSFEIINSSIAEGAQLTSNLTIPNVDGRVEIIIINEEEFLTRINALRDQITSSFQESGPDFIAYLTRNANELEETIRNLSSTITNGPFAEELRTFDFDTASAEELLSLADRLESFKSMTSEALAGFTFEPGEREDITETLESIIDLITQTTGWFGTGSRGLVQYREELDSASGYTRKALEDIISGIVSVTDTTQNAFTTLAGFSINISDFYSAISTGVVSLDTISQSSGALENSLQSATADVIIATNALNSLTDTLNSLPTDSDAAVAVEAEIEKAETNLALARASLAVANEQYTALQDLLEPRRRQLEISKEIQESFKAELELAKLTFSELGEGYALAANETEKTANRQAFLVSIISEGTEAYRAQQQQLNAIKNITGLLPNQVALFNTATTDTVESLTEGLGLEEEIAESIKKAVVLTTEQADEANNVVTATEALFGLQLGIVQNANSVVDKLKEQNTTLERQIELQQNAARVAALENSIKNTEIQNQELNDSLQLSIDALVSRVDLLKQEQDILKTTNDVATATSDIQVDNLNTQLEAIDARYSSEIAYLETIAEIIQSNQNNALVSLREQALALDDLFNIAEVQEAIKTNIELSSLDIQEIKVSDLESILTEAIQAQVDILGSQIANLQEDYANRIKILDIEQAQAQEKYNLERQILSEQLMVAERNIEYTRANAIATIRQGRILLDSAELQRQLEAQQLTQSRDMIAAEIALEAQKRDNAIKDINTQTSLNIAKEQVSVDDALRQIEVVTAQENVFNNFLNEYARLINEQAKIADPESVGVEPAAIRENFDTLITDLNSQRTEIENNYNRLAILQRASINNNSIIATNALESEDRILSSKIESLEESNELEQQLAIETFESRVALARSEVEAAIQARSSAISELNALDEDYTNSYKQNTLERAQIEQQLAADIETAIAESSTAILEYYAQINNGLKDFIGNTKTQIASLAVELSNLQNEKFILDIELELGAIDLQRELDEQLANAQISNLQAQIQLVESQEAGNVLSAVEAAGKVNDLQLQILDIQEDMLNDRIVAENVSLTLQNELLAQKAKIDEANIIAQADLQVANAQAQFEFLSGLTNSFISGISGQRSVFQSFTTALAQTFTSAANAVNKAIVSALGEYAGARIGAAVTAGIVAEADIAALNTNLQSAGAALTEYASVANDTATMQLEMLDTQTQADIEANEARIRANQESYNLALATSELERQNQEQQFQNALADAAGGDNGGDADKLDDMLKSLQEQFKSSLQSITDLVSELLEKTIDIIGNAIVRVQQANIDQLKVQEDLVSSILSGTESRLSDIQSSLNETLEEEVSLREQIKTQTEELVKTQEDLIKSFTLQDNAIADTSALYIDKLLEQKNSMISLGKASDTVIALQKEEKSLIQQQADQQSALESITNDRLEAEKKLETTQGLLGLASEVLSGKFTELQNSFVELGNTINAVLQIIGIAGGVPGNSMLGLNAIGESVLEFKKGVEEFVAAGGNLSDLGEGASSQAIAVGEIQESLGISANALNITASAIGGALQGFSVGNVIAGIVGDTGIATAIGGAIGGAAGAALAASGIISATISGVLGSVLTFAVPIIGPIIGALIGSIFKKTPKASVAGIIGAEGSEVTRESSTGGAKQETSMALFGLAEQSINAMISMLESAGITFTETVAVSIEMSGDKIKNATLQFGDDVQKFTSGVLGKGQAGAEAAAEFFTESFVKALQVGDLVTADAQLQLALDRFASIADLTLKTPEKLQETITFVTSFEESLASLQSTGISTAYVLDTITTAALANSDALAAYYTSFLAQTSEVFGETSTQFTEASAAVRENALALVGLGEITVDGVTTIVSLSEALGELNAGAIVVSEAIDTILNSTSALAAAGIENVSEVQSQAITTAIDSLLTDISTELSDAISILKDPANAAITELENILNESADVLSVQQGIYDELISRQAAGIEVTNEQLAQAEQNIALQEELINLNLEAYLSSLTMAELEAVYSSGLLTEELQALTEAQLAAVKAIDQQKALKILIDSTEQFFEAMNNAGADFVALPILGVATDYQTLAESIESTEITPFVTDLTDMINSIAAGTDVVANYEEALSLINAEYAETGLATEEAAILLEQLNEASVEYVDALQVLYAELESITNNISQILTESIDNVESSIEELANVIIESLENLVSSSQDILGIFDDTLSTVAESGNELFDLRDTALKALNDSSKAVKEFEKQNNLSGKSSAQLASELAEVQANLNALLSDPSIDLAEFMQISALTSQQRYLQNEIANLTEVEAEYAELLGTRNQAAEDLSYAESVLLSLGEQLVDTRRSESDVIKQIQDTTTEFVKAQEDLLEITKLLDEANFDLLQARIDEEDAVLKVKNALELYTSSLASLEENVSGILEGTLLYDTVQVAIDNYALSLETSGIIGEEAASKLEDFTASAQAAGDQILYLIEGINEFLNPDLPDPNEIPIPDYATVINSSLTNAFTQFNSDLVKYLDTEGMAQFYGPGGKFATFRNALVSTLITDGFDVLTISGGPLENFNSYLIGVSSVISDLIEDNATLDLSIQGVTTEVGVLVTGLGKTAENTTSASSAIVILGDKLATAVEGTYEFDTAVGTFVLSITDDNGRKAMEILTTNYPEAISSFNNSILLFDSELSGLTITSNLGSVSAELNTNIEIYNSTIDTLTVSTNAGTVSKDIKTTVDIFNSTISSLVLSATVTETTDKIYQTINSVNSDIDSIAGIKVSTTVGGTTDTIFATVSDVTTDINSIATLKISTTADDKSLMLYENLYAANEALNDISTIQISNLPDVESLSIAFDELLNLFNPASANLVNNVSDAITELGESLLVINNTPGLASSLAEPADDIAALAEEWATLSETLVGFVGSDGTIQGIGDAITNIAQDLSDAWEDVVKDLNTEVASMQVTVSIPEGGLPTTSSSTDALLSEIKTNTSKFKPIEGVSYKKAETFATGGLVEGPGTGISDSVPARLSRGEYVLKADVVKRIGTDALNVLNTTGDINSALASNGRYGDTLLAHINENEAALLKRLGGSGTINPRTGLREFFTDPGVIGSAFAKQEAAYLKSIALGIDSGYIDSSYDMLNSGNNDKTRISYTASGGAQANPVSKLLSTDEISRIKKSLTDTYKVLQLSTKARKLAAPNEIISDYATNTFWGGKDVDQNLLKVGNLKQTYPNIGTGWAAAYGANIPSTAGGYRARSTQALAMWAANTTEGLPTYATDSYAIEQYVAAMNRRQGNFTDFYMLSNGGLVGDDLSISTARDRAPALLEPGEFVLRKQAVESLGINNAIRLNATGDTGSEPNIEVNIVNNGTPINSVDAPTLRKENGKLVVDIVLDDLRNNGPIKRQIKSIR